MHEYAISQAERRWVWVSLFGLSCLFSISYCSLCKWFPCLTLPCWMDGPSVLAVFAFLNIVYRKWGWRKTFCGLRMSQVTDYSGEWEGVIHSSYNNGTTVNCKLVIVQDWNYISCELSTVSSRSISTSASIREQTCVNGGLTWRYVNTPDNENKELHMHQGLCVACFAQDGVLKCNYFNCGRDRQTVGTIDFKRSR